MSTTAYDYLIIGAGMAGASVAYELAQHGRTLLIEREGQPGYHATGRSAALYSETYGNATVRRLTSGSRRFFEAPPSGFDEHPLLTPRGTLFIGRADQQAALQRTFEEGSALVGDLRQLDTAEILAMVPVVRREWAAAGVLEPGAMDIDVHALHQGFLRGLRARGGALVTDAGCDAAERRGGAWEVTTGAGRFSAAVLVNAAGAWVDQVAAAAGVAPLGFSPRRRTALTFAAPPLPGVAGWPMVIDADESFYFKPESGRLLASPADETPVEPSDVQPEELDVAICVDRLQQATTLDIRRIEHRWAGLRTFAADRTPVVGFEPAAEGFFWLAGQGGYGIQTSPAMGRLAAALITGRGVPAELAALGLREADLAPARLRQAA